MRSRLRAIIESLIFISLEPLTMEKIKTVLTDYQEKEIKAAVDDLLQSYSSVEHGIQIVQATGGFIFSTNPEHDRWIKRLLHIDKKDKLSPAAMETLSTVAYHQPITLAEISAIRGVDSTHALKTLLLKRFVKITGRKKSPGRPLIYRTSKQFLTYFGLDSIKDLPTKQEIEKILEEERDND
jgi:segregation and condensation protein B